MNLFIELHQKLIKKLIDGKVDFIIIGGYSVIFHGYKRTTGDVDIWLNPDNNNKKKLLSVLKDLGFTTDELNSIDNIDFTKHTAFSLWNEPEKVDFITIINLVSYVEASTQKIIADVDGMQIPFLHLNHLILSKINTGRLQDKADIEKLQEIEQKRNKK